MEGFGSRGGPPACSPRSKTHPGDLRSLWLRAVADSRREIEQLRNERPDLRLDQDFDALLAERWPQACQADIASLAREEAGDYETRYRAARRRLEHVLPEDYPFARCGPGAGK